MEGSYSLPLSVSPAFSSPPSSGMYKSARPGEARGQGWILAGKRSPSTFNGTRCQSGSVPVRFHTPLTEGVWGLLWKGSVGGFSGLLWVCTGPKDGRCEFHGVQVSVPGRSCSTFAWNMAGCRTWTWAPGGSRPQCSHLYTLQRGQTRKSLTIPRRTCIVNVF